MIIERDVTILMDDGLELRADVFRPDDNQLCPAIMTLGPYGKGVPYRTGFAPQWKWLLSTHPDVLPSSSKEYMVWETVDPETWVPWGYACIRVDSRGAGRSPGKLEIFSPRETLDYFHAIEWAAAQPWCTGKVGLNGISYYAINQWAVAALQPPHLMAMIPWEGAADNYRDVARHGGIASNAFLKVWYERQVVSVQHGQPKAITDPWLNQSATGPERLSEAELAANRCDPVQDYLSRPLDGPWYTKRSVDWSKVTVPFLSAANWAGFGLHPRGNFEAFTQAASKQKWLECHPGRHEEWFYLDHGMALQKRFLDHFLKDEANGWDREPSIRLNIRRPLNPQAGVRMEESWPLADTNWTKLYLSTERENSTLLWTSPQHASSVTFEAKGQPVTFVSPPLEQETEITGPLALKVVISSSTIDADLFVTFQAFSPEGAEVEFQGTVDPHTPLAQGWLRASHRKLDLERSTPYRPYHSHDEAQSLNPGENYELDVEVWPTHIVLPAEYRLALQISGKDFEREAPKDANEAWVAKGSGPWLHNHEEDRPDSIFAGRTTVYTGRDDVSYLLLPVIPARK